MTEIKVRLSTFQITETCKRKKLYKLSSKNSFIVL